MFSVQVIGAVRADHPLGGTVGHVYFPAQDLPPVEIPDPDPFGLGFHKGIITYSGFWILDCGFLKD
jgi:hypothetical protein